MALKDDLTVIFRTVFDDDTIELTRETSANDIEGWDSLSHTLLILAIENHFQIEFNQREVRKLKDVGDLLDIIQRKLA